MMDINFIFKREKWAFVAFLGLLSSHVGIVMSILAFEGAINQGANIYVEVFGILFILSGLLLIIISAYLRRLQRNYLKMFSQRNRDSLSFRSFPNYEYSGKTKVQKQNLHQEPKFQPSKSRVVTWYSESSGPLPVLDTERSIQNWMDHHHHHHHHHQQQQHRNIPSHLSTNMSPKMSSLV